jgi:hypothetical protein
VPGNDWFAKTRIELGTFFGDETAVGHFEFRNPRDVAHKLSNIQPSCTCAKAVVRIGGRTYEIGSSKILYQLVTNGDGREAKERRDHIEVAAGESGDVEAHMTMSGIRGKKQATLGLQISDQKLPLVNLQWQATGAEFFQVVPPEINLNEMSWAETRERERDGGGPITFKTDLKDKRVTARVVAFLKGPLTMKPGGFVGLGVIDRDEGKAVEITLTPTGEFDLQVESLEVERFKLKKELRDYVTFESRKDGKDVIVVIRVEKGMKGKQRAYLSGLLKIHLNHPAAKIKEVMFNGFVR